MSNSNDENQDHQDDVYVRTDGCVRLGTSVSVDGFIPACPIRIQTHAHYDHLSGFDDSKKSQKKIVLTQATFDLLLAEGNQDDLQYRRRQLAILPADGTTHEIEGVRVALYPSAHMIGSAMPVVIAASGKRLMYSSDFSWPLPIVPPKVDVLVLDSTYGDPASQPDYNDKDVIREFIEVFQELWAQGSVIIRGHRGRLQYVAQLLANLIHSPFLLGPHVERTFEVFCRHQNFALRSLALGSHEAQALMRRGEKFVALLEERDRNEAVGIEVQGRVMWLSRFSLPHERPIVRYQQFIRVGLTDHADFKGTIELIKQTSPSLVIADGSRGGNADALAAFVQKELRINAHSRLRDRSLEWGG